MALPEIPLAVPSLGGNAARYLNQCLADNQVSSVGPFVERFEREFAAAVGTRHAVACASGTAALHVALQLAGARPGALVAVPAFTFIASAIAIACTGAQPWLVDSGPRTASYREGSLAGRQVGTIGDLGCFSFNGNKVMTTGGGGMIVTDDASLAARAHHLTTQAKVPGPGYVHDEVGYNYRLSNLAAALGVAQLERLPELLAAKRAVAQRYRCALEPLGLTPAPHATWADPTFWLYSPLLPAGGPGAGEVAARLQAEGVQARRLWPPLHHQAPYRDAPLLGGRVSEALYRSGLSLPSSADLHAPDQQRVVDMLTTTLTSRPGPALL